MQNRAQVRKPSPVTRPGEVSDIHEALSDLGPANPGDRRPPGLDSLDNWQEEAWDDSREEPAPITHPPALQLDENFPLGMEQLEQGKQDDRLALFKLSREEVTIRTEIGDYVFKAVKVIASPTSFVLLFDMDNEGPVFSPRPLSYFTLVHLEKEYRCFYPGVEASIEELGLRMLCLGIDRSKQTNEEVQA